MQVRASRHLTPPTRGFNSVGARIDTGMALMTFIEFIIRHEGVLMADRPPAAGLPRMNTTAVGDARRANLRAKPSRPTSPLQPTVGPVAQIVPQAMVPTLRPLAVDGRTASDTGPQGAFAP